MELKANQAALILEANDDGEITVNDIASLAEVGLAVEICQIIAKKLATDEQFQAEIMACLEEE